MKKIFVVDDDPDIAGIIKKYLEREGFETRVFNGADGLLAVMDREWPDMFILDIMMPGMDGLELCREIRRRGNVPVIFVSARGEEVDRVLGLELGGDDYLTKPFSPRELVARVRTVLRRSAAPPPAEAEIRVGDITVYPARREATVGGSVLDLTVKEFDLLHLLAGHPGQALSRDQILDRVWGMDYVGDTRAVDDVVKRLRRKLKEKGARTRVSTVWGYGYKISV
ncbi:response regulator transcription factor [Desulfallas sp. Bu1-1]|uniref:response regulator transcription factor n=1 Tax=Desulfallas sp. Bu1-1 TaxID=2787620 RepID=UPI00189DB1AA|nr:response regulator transcription factor [Desulfallas sp. Bu1-1]MBF7083755.1 response regulator transcription factor [Desulfallas sp. Bu1-1]